MKRGYISKIISPSSRNCSGGGGISTSESSAPAGFSSDFSSGMSYYYEENITGKGSSNASEIFINFIWK